MLAITIATEAQVLGSQHQATADGIVNLPYDRAKSTGIKFHVTSCTSGGGFGESIRVRNNDFVDYIFHIYGTDGRFISFGSNRIPITSGVVHFVAGDIARAEGVFRPQIKICNHAQLAYPITVAKWEDQGEHNDAPQSRYYHVRSTLIGVDTGIVFHRSGSTCRFNDVRLVDPPTWLELRKYTAAGAADGAAATRFTVRMEEDHAEDRQVRLLFKPGVTVALGQHVATMAVARHVASAGCSGGLDTTLTLSYTLNITNQADWRAQGPEQVAAAVSYRSDGLSGAALGLGLTIHRNPGICEYTAVSLAGDSASFLELRAYSTATRRQVGAAAAILPSVLMRRGATGDGNVQVFSKAGAAALSPGRKDVTIVVRASERCSGQTGLPEPQTLTLAWTVLSPYTAPEPWQAGSADDATPHSSFDPRHLSGSSAPVPTGVYLQRTSASCRNIRHEILSGHKALDFYVVDGNGSRGARQGDRARIDISASSLVGLYFEPGVQLQAESVLPVSIQIQADPGCRQGAAAQNLAFALTIGKVGSWHILAGDTATVTALFQPARLRAATSATDTGLRFHRGSSVCPQLDLAVQPAAFLELRKYNGSTADGAAAPSLSNVRMQVGHANDRRVGVQFKAGAQLTAGPFTATVVAQVASGCADANAPQPLTLAYELAVLDSWPWRAGAQDNFGTPAQLDTLDLGSSASMPTGLRVHRNSRNCSSTDVALASDAPAYLSLQRYGGSGPDGAAARSLTGVPMSGSGASDRHVRVMLASGAALQPGATVLISLTVSANASCASATGVPAALELVGSLVGSSEGLDAAMQVGTALAVRTLGAETLGAVMARPGAPANEGSAAQLLGMLAAKEKELESGEIDLREFLAGQQFALPLASSANGLPSGLVLWGRAAKYDVGSAVDNGPQVDSDLFSGSFGVDYRMREGLLLGLGYGRHEQEGHFSHRGAAGSYQLDLNLYQPYAAAQIGPGWLAAYGSQGTGNLLVESRGADLKPRIKADYIGWGLGWYNDIERWDLRLRAGASAGELEFEENHHGMNAEAGTARLAVAYAPGRNLVVDVPIQPEFEVAWADEWGDAAGDSSWLLALAFEYAGTGPLHLRAAYRRAVSGGGDYAGTELDLRVDPNRGGLGPSFALRPRYGLDTGAAVFEQAGRPQGFTAGDDHGRRWRAELAYGLPVSGGVLTPYSDWSVDNREQSRRLGLRLGTGAYGDWNLGWRRAASAADKLHLELRIGD